MYITLVRYAYIVYTFYTIHVVREIIKCNFKMARASLNLTARVVKNSIIMYIYKGVYNVFIYIYVLMYIGIKTMRLRVLSKF